MKRLAAFKNLARRIPDGLGLSRLSIKDCFNSADKSDIDAINAYHGSMGAALALHQRVLGKVSQYSIAANITHGRVSVTFWPDGLPDGKAHSGAALFGGNPSRAWLLAIVRAKISVLEDE